MMKEPGTPAKDEKIQDIDSIKTTMCSYFEGWANVTFSESESDVDSVGELVTRTSGTGTLEINDGKLSLSCKISIIEQGAHRVSVHILVGDPRYDILCLELRFEDQKNGIVQMLSDVRKRNITRHDSMLPKGIGLQVYDLIPGLLKKLAQVKNKEYVHTIQRATLMEKEVWLQTFNKFITDNAYQYTPSGTEDTWVKSYV